jgi:hypothetical protein
MAETLYVVARRMEIRVLLDAARRHVEAVTDPTDSYLTADLLAHSLLRLFVSDDRCDACDPSFGCFDGAARCRKSPPIDHLDIEATRRAMGSFQEATKSMLWHALESALTELEMHRTTGQ